MTFRAAIWQPIAVALAAINLVGLGLAVGAAEPAHMTVHAVLAGVFGLAAWRIRPGSGRERQEESQAGLEDVEAELGHLRQELIETQERLDFTERILAQGLASRRVEPERREPPAQ